MANPQEWPQAPGCFSLHLNSPIAMWTDSTGWATVSAQICRLCKASTPSTDSRRFFTAVKSTPLGVPGDRKHNGKGHYPPIPLYPPGPSTQKASLASRFHMVLPSLTLSCYNKWNDLTNLSIESRMETEHESLLFTAIWSMFLFFRQSLAMYPELVSDPKFCFFNFLGAGITGMAPPDPPRPVILLKIALKLNIPAKPRLVPHSLPTVPDPLESHGLGLSQGLKCELGLWIRVVVPGIIHQLRQEQGGYGP